MSTTDPPPYSRAQPSAPNAPESVHHIQPMDSQLEGAQSPPIQTVQCAPATQPLVQAYPANNAFKLWIKNNEITQETARHLVSVLTRVKIVMLIDDSSSMGSNIIEPGAQTNLFANTQNQKTRWMEAQQAAVTLVNMITALPNQYTFDVWFLNRGKIIGVSKPSDLQSIFNAGRFEKSVKIDP